MIATNYRKHPEALALQLPLAFGHVLKWALKRPGARVLRSIRAERAAMFKAVGRVIYPEKPTTPAWFKAASQRARELARMVKAAILPIHEHHDATNSN